MYIRSETEHVCAPPVAVDGPVDVHLDPTSWLDFKSRADNRANAKPPIASLEESISRCRHVLGTIRDTCAGIDLVRYVLFQVCYLCLALTSSLEPCIPSTPPDVHACN